GDAKSRREPPLVEADISAAAIDVHGDDGVLERGIGAALEAIGTADALDARRYRSAGGTARGRGAHPATATTAGAIHDWYTIFHSAPPTQPTRRATLPRCAFAKSGRAIAKASVGYGRSRRQAAITGTQKPPRV